MEQPPVAEVGHLTVSYGGDPVLKDVSAAFPPSRITLILGTSGCGKTTLLKAMLGLLRPVSGFVRLFGRDLADQDDPGSVETL